MFILNARATCTVILIAAYFQTGFATTHWDYNNEDEWPEECKVGTKQSPIALSREIAQDEDFQTLIFEQYDVTYPVQSKNNGHSLEVRLHVQNQPTVKGGGLPHIYVLDHFHFHWQSEHVIEDTRFPLEVHLVHYASEYANLTEALKHTNGVAVFAVLFYLSPDNDEHYDPLMDIIEKVHDQVNTVQELYVKLDDFLPRDRAGFYRYNGSLTTPDCNEGIIWTIFTNKLPMSGDQVQSFPTIETEEHEALHKNYRSLQQLNGRRVVLRSSPIDNSGSALYVDFNFKIFILVFLVVKEPLGLL